MIRDIASFIIMSVFMASMFVALPAFVAVFHDQNSAMVAASERK